jgi:hypothetical protein
MLLLFLVSMLWCLHFDCTISHSGAVNSEFEQLYSQGTAMYGNHAIYFINILNFCDENKQPTLDPHNCLPITSKVKSEGFISERRSWLFHLI